MLILLLSLACPALAPGGDEAAGPKEQQLAVMMAELERLSITLDGEVQTGTELEIPGDLMRTHFWGMITPNCRKAGYDLKRHAGIAVEQFHARISEPGESAGNLRVFVLMSGAELVCVYKNDDRMVPGVYPATMTVSELGQVEPRQ